MCKELRENLLKRVELWRRAAAIIIMNVQHISQPLGRYVNPGARLAENREYCQNINQNIPAGGHSIGN